MHCGYHDGVAVTDIYLAVVYEETDTYLRHPRIPSRDRRDAKLRDGGSAGR